MEGWGPLSMTVTCFLILGEGALSNLSLKQTGGAYSKRSAWYDGFGMSPFTREIDFEILMRQL